MNKFNVGQKVVIDSGIFRGRTVTIIEVLPRSLLQWYLVHLEDYPDGITYVECELRSLN